ncbi:hypothetical protein [Aquicoccus sp.]|uniref:hypothetical protein n=1 Tax=Aquicoccus sp. TaxID=2055851 RepID=UPI003565B527
MAIITRYRIPPDKRWEYCDSRLSAAVVPALSSNSKARIRACRGETFRRRNTV